MRQAGLSFSEIGRSLKISKSAAAKYVSLARAAGVDWALAQTLSDEELEARLYRSMRQIHVAGEKLFVDYAGETVPIVDPSSGEITAAQIFVATFGASNYTYACATARQTTRPPIQGSQRLTGVRTANPLRVIGSKKQHLPPFSRHGAICKAVYDPTEMASRFSLKHRPRWADVRSACTWHHPTDEGHQSFERKLFSQPIRRADADRDTLFKVIKAMKFQLTLEPIAPS